MASKKELKSMSIPALEKHINALDGDRQQIRANMIEAHALLDKKNTQEAARRRLETLSDPEKAALLQELKTEGVKSEAAVGMPGASE